MVAVVIVVVNAVVGIHVGVDTNTGGGDGCCCYDSVCGRDGIDGAVNLIVGGTAQYFKVFRFSEGYLRLTDFIFESDRRPPLYSLLTMAPR